jgi:uncharacterized protein
MGGLYVDTSGLARVLLDTPEKREIVAQMAGRDLVISSRLLRIELRRVALREGELDGVDQLLAGISLVPIDEGILVAAESVKPANVATLDALHLATVVRLAGADVVDAVLTYDKRLAEATRHHGLEVVAPV